MGTSLVIVESPAKAKTDQPLSRHGLHGQGLDGPRPRPAQEASWGSTSRTTSSRPTRSSPTRRRSSPSCARRPARATRVILAADPDREGEAISWHLGQLLEDDNKHIFRATFHEITEEGVRRRVRAPGPDRPQPARRPADPARPRPARRLPHQPPALEEDRPGPLGRARPVRSPCGSSATGRRRSRPSSRRNTGRSPPGSRPRTRRPSRPPWPRSTARRPRSATREQARIVREDCQRAAFVLDKVQVKPKLKHPGPPYITSTLQQDGFRLLRFPVKKTMFVAQKLYEGMPIGELGLTGLITYMRTDSVRVSADGPGRRPGLHRAGLLAGPRPGQAERVQEQEEDPGRPRGHPAGPRRAHARRRSSPTSRKRSTTSTSSIWKKFIASQMAPAKIEETAFDIAAGRYLFQAKGEVVKFDGFLAVWPNGSGDKETPAQGRGRRDAQAPGARVQAEVHRAAGPLHRGDAGQGARGPGHRPAEHLRADHRHHPDPDLRRQGGGQVPAHRAGDVRHRLPGQALRQAHGIQVHRPHGGGARPDLRGRPRRASTASGSTTRCSRPTSRRAARPRASSRRASPSTRNARSAARPWSSRAAVSAGSRPVRPTPSASSARAWTRRSPSPSTRSAPSAARQLDQKFGRFGPFVACSDYPKCKYIKKDVKDTGIACPLGCGGKILRRKTRQGKLFFGCSHYPKCTFASWDEPIDRACPQCGAKILYKKNLIKGEPYIHCKNEKCTFKEAAPREKIWETAVEGAPRRRPRPGRPRRPRRARPGRDGGARAGRRR
ncbi:MAG: DNA topoisomerase [Desulfosudis oleivorans]|nr:DNA topoisomerase [Desulfosudis oleivorans]